MSGEIVLRGGTILTMDAEMSVTTGDVACRDGQIIQVGGDHDQLLNVDQVPALERDARQAPTDALLDLLRDIEDSQRQATRHLNVHMALENILLRFRDALLASTPQPA